MNTNKEVREVVLCPPEVVEAITHETEAVVESWMRRHVKYSQREACIELDIDKGNFSRMLDQRTAIPKNKRTDFMALTGNLLPLQVEAKMFGCAVVPIIELEKLKNQERYPSVSFG